MPATLTRRHMEPLEQAGSRYAELMRLAQLQEQAPGLDLSPRCQITWIYYAGDEGGILCKLDFGQEDTDQAFFVSITHLTFDRRLPLAREIAAYQKHRVKRIRRSSSGSPSGPSH